MNKIYKVVWNATRGCYVVASELVKTHQGKKSTRRGGEHPFPCRDGTAPCYRRLRRGLQFHLRRCQRGGSGAHWQGG